MRRTVARSGLRHLVPALGLGLVLLMTPAAALADEPVTGAVGFGLTADAAGYGLAADAAGWPAPAPAPDPGPVLLLLVAGTLGLLGALSGPDTLASAHRPSSGPRGRARGRAG